MDKSRDESPLCRQEPLTENVDAAERQRTTGNAFEAVEKLTFGQAMNACREQDLPSPSLAQDLATRHWQGAKICLLGKPWDFHWCG